jgi:hypothetical protein
MRKGLSKMLPRKVIGVEQVGTKQIEHTKIDPRPILSLIAWALLTILVLGVAADCDDSGMYQGPNDESPRYGGPK